MTSPTCDTDRRAAITVLFSVVAQSCHSVRPLSSNNRVRLALSRGSFFYLPVYVAQSLGYFQDETLSVTLQETSAAPKSMQAILGGSSDVAVGGLIQVLLAIVNDRHLKIFTVMQRQPGFVALVSPRTSRPIRRIEDLKGVNVGVTSPGAEHHLILNYLLQQHGLSPSDVQPVAVGTGASQAAALEHGTVDVGLAAGPTIPMLLKRHPKLPVLFDLRNPENTRALLGVDDLPSSVLYATREWLDRNPELAQRLAHSIRRASDWIRSHAAEEVRKKLPDSCRTEDEAIDLQAIRFTSQMLSLDGQIKPVSVSAALRILGSSIDQARKAHLDLRQIYTNQYLQGN